MRSLIVYPNASMGGVASVIRGRAIASPAEEFDVVYFRDRGGLDAFGDLSNVRVVLSTHSRAANYITHLLRLRKYESVSFLSCPDVLEKVEMPDGLLATYEFHSSDTSVISKELATLRRDKLAKIVVPSQAMAVVVSQLSAAEPMPVEVVPNLIDPGSFHRGDNSPAPDITLPDNPLVWVGRFDKGKAYRAFIRLLSMTPESTHGIMVVSLESEPERVAEALGEAAMQGVASRLTILSNMSQQFMGRLYRHAREHGGWLISTSLLESFGYSVAEALACGLRVAAFDLPALREHPDPNGLLRLADIGNVMELAAAVRDDAK